MKNLSNRINEIIPSPTLKLDAIAKQMIREGVDVINLSVGEPDIDTPQTASQAAIKAIESGFTKYTDVGAIEELRVAVAARAQKLLGLKYNSSDVVVSNGGKHSLFNIFSTLLNAGDEVVIPSPYWVSYPEQVKLAGGNPVICKTDESTGFLANASILESLLTDHTKAIIINSPSNPTGAVYSRNTLIDIAALARERDLYLISDEIYDQLTFLPNKHVSIAQLSDDAKERTIIVNGWSKTYGMTGWRLGYTLSNPNLAKAFRNFQGHTTSNVCSIAQWAALGALDTDISSLANRFQTRRDLLVNGLRSINGIQLIEPGGAFYVFPNLVKLLNKKHKGLPISSVDLLCNLLLEEYKVSIVPGSGFGAPENVRISYAIDEDKLIEAIARIREFVSQLTN